jgi:FHA domain-containing protein
MIHIQVITYNGLPPPQPIVATFNEIGGNIGRADGNALILPDPERHISRIHASIALRAGGYVIRDFGTATPVYVNSHPLGTGQEASIVQGDEIRIGGYTMRVTGDYLSVAIPPQGARLSKEAVVGSTDRAVKPVDDIFAVPAARVPADVGVIPPDFDPFASPTPLYSSPAPSPSSSLPDDWSLGFGLSAPDRMEPSALDRLEPSAPDIRGPSALDRLGPSALDMMGPSAPDQSIDKLFGLGVGKGSEPFPPGNPLAEPLDQPNAVASVDPLVALGVATFRSKSVGGSPQRDDVPELRSAFRPPEAKPDTARPAVSPMASPAAEHTKSPAVAIPSSHETPGMVLSWESMEPGTGIGETKSVIVTSSKLERERRQGERRKAASAGAVSVAVSPTRLAGEYGQVTPAMKSMPSPHAQQQPASPIAEVTPRLETPPNHHELLRAFLTGAGVPDLAVPSELTPQMMGMFGRLLRESTQGTLDLLLARALTKREVRAEMTMIEVRENNPLKFSPSVEVALAHLLAPQGRGFMKPFEAVKDAYDDLRSHQFGFMAGMRAALAGVLERFNPGRLEQRLTQKTMIDSLLPMNRKAKLWDLFSARYDDISKEAEDDFNALFGKEFLRAYEAQIAKLEQDDKSIKR